MSFKALLAFCLLLSQSLFAEVLEMDMRWRQNTYRSSVLEQSIRYDVALPYGLGATLGGRLSERSWDLDSFYYLAELHGEYFGIFFPAVRFQHRHRFGQTSTTQLFLHAEFELSPVREFGFILGGGWQQRWSRVEKASVAPNLFRSDFRDPDWAAVFGFRFSPIPPLEMRLLAGTYDAYEAFNLNNPFGELRAEWTPPHSKIQYFGFARYKILLGFGRLDEFVAGFGAKFQLGPMPQTILTES